MDTTKKEGMMQTLARASPLAPYLFKPDKNPPKVSIRAIIFWGIIVYALQAFLVVCIAAISLNDKIQETAIFKSPADAPVSARGAWNCTPLSSWDTRALWPGSGAAKTYEGAGGAFSAVGEAAMSASECKAKVKEAAFCTTFAEGYVGPTGKCCIWGNCVNGDTELPPCGGLIEQDDGFGGYCDLEYFNTDPAFTNCFSFNFATECPGKAPPICNLPSPPANTGWKNPMMGYQKSTAVLDLAKLETKLLDMGTPVPVNDPDGWQRRRYDPRASPSRRWRSIWQLAIANMCNHLSPEAQRLSLAQFTPFCLGSSLLMQSALAPAVTIANLLNTSMEWGNIRYECRWGRVVEVQHPHSSPVRVSQSLT
ncbi:hypothetical protein EMIHUDRAFT_209144 [Emiliania huxleyi CCMP1516]|uniref:Uncharacterized protein n=2 Tax=Emiliania huxleyi TaxID=2903 RepID=A0A0D3J7R7_EMIH1|nr:hypothetical protein EMIHUDRAFT_209144 [Emiliania huxleyi CCMP1516]EOD19552.1 hypothetical protein EMIHUDRAFT_209144 [Emiliania huxleyi CCMP1516]|eukprot:XP_005771981.1 hypothetical protein EMIHUDRAFT_209144 [Emiliania huxleyi CCMP1516]